MVVLGTSEMSGLRLHVEAARVYMLSSLTILTCKTDGQNRAVTKL